MSKEKEKEEIIRISYMFCNYIDNVLVESDDEDLAIEELKNNEELKMIAEKIKKFFHGDYKEMDCFYMNSDDWNTYYSNACSSYIKELFP